MAVGRGRSRGPRVFAVAAWTVTWAPCGRRGGVAGPLGPVWPTWGRGRSPGPSTAAVGAPKWVIRRMSAIVFETVRLAESYRVQVFKIVRLAECDLVSQVVQRCA